MADPSPRLSQTVAGTGVIRRLDWAGCPGRHGHVAAVGAVVGGGQARPWTAGGLPTCRTESQVEGAL